MSPTKRFIPLLLALPIVAAGCGSKELPAPAESRSAWQVPAEALTTVRPDVVVPQSALVREGALVGLYVVGKDERPVLRWVRLGRSEGGRVAILAGVEEGERVVVDPALLQQENQTENRPEGVKTEKEYNHE